jgi:predicted nucleotidyltransferase
MSAPRISETPAPGAPADPTRHPAMRRFAEAVRALYGDRVERIVLYGSRARGDARDDSDWDVAVFVRGPLHWWGEVSRLGDLSTKVLDETGEIISAKPFPAGAYADRTILMHELRRDGINL